MIPAIPNVQWHKGEGINQRINRRTRRRRNKQALCRRGVQQSATQREDAVRSEAPPRPGGETRFFYWKESGIQILEDENFHDSKLTS
jgi:hypothetical protein